MRISQRTLIVVLTVFAAAAALAAADTKPVAPSPAAPAPTSGAASVSPQATAPQAGLADIPENQAEREAMQRGELKLEVPEGVQAEPAIDAARQARRQAFDNVMAEQNARVQALADRLVATSGDEAVALQREMEIEKAALGRRLLELQLQFATQDGDEARADRIRSAIADWDAPKPTGTPQERTLPANPNR